MCVNDEERKKHITLVVVVTVHYVPACPHRNQSSHLPLPLLGFPAQMWDQMLYFLHYSMLLEALVAAGTWSFQFSRLRVRDDNDSKHRVLSAMPRTRLARDGASQASRFAGAHHTKRKRHIHGICHFMIREHCCL
jgi:hypothetical protein